MKDIIKSNGERFCVPCYLTQMAVIQGYAICPYCENSEKIT